MNTKLTCPVCDRPEIESDICPNCETDLSTIRLLAELPPLETSSQLKLNPSKIASKLPLAVAVLILVIGITLGASGNFFLSQSSLSNRVIVSAPAETKISANPLAQSSPSGSPNLIAKIQQMQSNCAGEFHYKVRRQDTLWVIAERLYGKGRYWQEIVKANPALKQRQDSLIEGEILLVPNLDSNCR